MNDIEKQRSIDYSSNIVKGKGWKKAKNAALTVVAGMRLAPGMKVSADGYIYMEEKFNKNN